MKKSINSKRRIIGATMVVVAITMALVLALNGKSFLDWISPVSVETTDNEPGTPTTNATKAAPVSIPPLGSSKFDKEVSDIQQEGDQMIERADALIAKYLPENRASTNAAMQQRLADVKARLGKPAE